MRNLKTTWYNPFFSHIYVESEIQNHPTARAILARLPGAGRIEITHYKDLFNRKGQDFARQKHSPSLILAKKTGNLVYPGAPMCQDFGYDSFYYATSIMNCLYDCDYCYLQGMYPSAYVVVFVNLEDIFSEVSALPESPPVYLSVSYDSDLLALEGLTGYGKAWIRFAREHPEITLEIRTKSPGLPGLHSIKPAPNVIFSFTLSPPAIIKAYEHGAPSLKLRLGGAKKALDLGWKTRLCLEPLLYTKNWREDYQSLIGQIEQVFKNVQPPDISVGGFRVSLPYLKQMRKLKPECPMLQYPFYARQGIARYEPALEQEITAFVADRLRRLPGVKCYLWKEEND